MTNISKEAKERLLEFAHQTRTTLNDIDVQVGDDIDTLIVAMDRAEVRVAELEGALRSIAEGNPTIDCPEADAALSRYAARYDAIRNLRILVEWLQEDADNIYLLDSDKVDILRRWLHGSAIADERKEGE